jgi:CDP-paratose 2-epimerase
VCIPHLMPKTLLVTGSSGLIGSEVCMYFARELGYTVHGVDNNQRAVFFGPQGDTRWNQRRLLRELPGFVHHEVDIRDRAGVLALVREVRPAVVVHTAAQPSHDRAAAIPFDDFDTNAVGTLNLLEAARQAAPEAPFVHMSTNKVYGDAPNRIPLRELATRWDYADPAYEQGIPETFTIDQSKHSLFGASKVAADVMVQEYGRYFNLPTCALRGGCLTGPNHSGVELHGFLSYLVKCNLENREYKIFGYKGKQVRDNIHSDDLVSMFDAFASAPRSGEVYNAGGGRFANCSMLEAIAMCEKITGNRMNYSLSEQNRIGDHIWYVSDLSKFKAHYPGWEPRYGIEETLEQIFNEFRSRGN